MTGAYLIRTTALVAVGLAMNMIAMAQEKKVKHAGLGDTPERLAECYGKATIMMDDPEFKGASRYTFQSDTLTVTAVVGGNKCGQITYASKDGTKLPAKLVETLLQANVVPGVPWQKLQLGTTSPKWMARGEADGARVSRMAMDLPKNLIIGDLTFSEKFPRIKK